MDISELISMVGTPYKQLDDNGKALGCMLPVYLMYPEIPRYDWPPEAEFLNYFINILRKHGREIKIKDMQVGDVIAFRMPFNFLHVGVYVGNDEIIHCINGDSLEKFRLTFIVRRIEGVFRWEHQCGERFGKQ